MNGSIYLTATGALAYQRRLQMISNNLANANSAGFKQEKTHFRVFEESELPARQSIDGRNIQQSQAPQFWMQFNTLTDFSPGPLKQTQNPFDLALTGSGFFSVQTSDGPQYTRRGDFTLNEDGLLVTQEGYPVLGSGGEIRIDDGKLDSFGVDEDGNVFLGGQNVGELRIVNFEDLQGLQKVGDSLFKLKDPPPNEVPAADVRVSQGFLEASNVRPVNVMIEMIEVLRGYEAYQKMIRSIDEINGRAIHEIGSTG